MSFSMRSIRSRRLFVGSRQREDALLHAALGERPLVLWKAALGLPGRSFSEKRCGALGGASA